MVAYALELSLSNTAFAPDLLIAGSHDVVTDSIIVAAGQVLTRGALIGQQTSAVYGVVSTPLTVAGGANTGNGTIGTVTAGVQVKLGTYRITMTAATTYNVLDPTGELVGTGSTGVAFTGLQVAFTVTAGGTPFVANDGFNLAAEPIAGAGAGYYVLATGTATDGSQVPGNWAILAADINTSVTGTNAATSAPVYLAGEFDANCLSFGVGLTIAGIKLALRQEGTGIYIKPGAITAPTI